ncbi:hypothetical protein GF339_21850 [candidate division KSB3 bacterium]|uniref:HEAT repeat domain-containing protein n=1 Tax=candidate division KSB3 bacterium TaxID=2044937 RepID=A0A9D5K0A3_9BACT|nr:hypothetical protein [candidate division KSB3 bacterium]MBD3327246.1 hypothetical protein [candidate division KSB3 bacterium]
MLSCYLYPIGEPVMSFDLERYEEAIMSPDEPQRLNAGLELAEAISQLSLEELDRFSQPIVDLLLESLRNTDWEFRSLISNALIMLGKTDFVAKSTWFWKKLISTYTDVDAGLRSSVMDILKELGRSEYSLEILEPLIEGLQSDEKDMRILSANTLGRIRAREALPMLLQAAHDDNPNVAYNVVECLGDIGDTQAVPVLMELLRDHPDEWVQVAAVEALGKIGDQRASDLLLSLARKEVLLDPLITALGILGDTRSIPVLATYLKHSDQELRELAIHALVAIWEEVETIATFTGVHYEEETTRKILARSLTPKVKNMLLKEMHNEHMPEEFREHCAVLLSSICYHKALPSIVHLVEVYPLSKKIIEALKRYGKRAFSHLRPLLRHEDFRVRQSVALYVQHLAYTLKGADSQVETALLRLAEDENPIVNQIAFDALSDFQSPTAIAPLVRLLQQAPTQVGETIADLLSGFPKRQLYNVIREAMTTEDEDTLPFLIKILGHAGGEPEYLRKFFKHSSPQVQEASILAVGYTRNPRSIPLLLPFIMSRQNSLNRCAAAKSLQNLIESLGARLPHPRNVFDALFVMLSTSRNEEELATVAQALGALCRLPFDNEITEVNIAVVRGRLLDVISHVSHENKVPILQALSVFVDQSSFPIIREFRKFDSPQIQAMVAELYGELEPDLRVVADVADMISHAEYSFRKFWILAAGKLHAVELTDMLVPLLIDQDFRAEAFHALVLMGSAVLPNLARWFDHEDPRLQKMTALLLTRVAQDKLDTLGKSVQKNP